MCFVMTAGTKVKPFVSVLDYQKKPRALTHEEQIEHDKKVAKFFSEVLEKTGLGRSLEALAECAQPKSLFESMAEDEINNTKEKKMKTYTVSNVKHSVTVVANSKEKAEELVRRDSLIQMTMDGELKVEIDTFVSNIELLKEDGEVYGAILKTSYSDKDIEVSAEI